MKLVRSSLAHNVHHATRGISAFGRQVRGQHLYILDVVQDGLTMPVLPNGYWRWPHLRRHRAAVSRRPRHDRRQCPCWCPIRIPGTRRNMWLRCAGTKEGCIAFALSRAGAEVSVSSKGASAVTRTCSVCVPISS